MPLRADYYKLLNIKLSQQQHENDHVVDDDVPKDHITCTYIYPFTANGVVSSSSLVIQTSTQKHK